jgi:glycosyltransferase involved in cell wall biosynthesis
MDSKPLVSIIMNCYNGQDYLREAIDSVYRQSYQNWEIIFWDNASTDESGAIATSYDTKLRYFRAEKNTPLGPARNMALEKVTGDYIAFLDCDDTYLPDTLAKQVACMQSGNFAMVYGGVRLIDQNSKVIGSRKVRYRSGYIFGSLLKRYEISMVSTMIKRSALRGQALVFNEDFGFCPDYNLFMKIAAKNEVGVLPELIVQYRKSANSLTRKTLSLVSREIGQTLDELRALYPQEAEQHREEMAEARSKLGFYDAVSEIGNGDYPSARAVLKPLLARKWQYLALYLILFLPVPTPWLLRRLNR